MDGATPGPAGGDLTQRVHTGDFVETFDILGGWKGFAGLFIVFWAIYTGVLYVISNRRRGIPQVRRRRGGQSLRRKVE